MPMTSALTRQLRGETAQRKRSLNDRIHRPFARTIHEIDDDHCLGLATQLASYFLLALFPARLIGVALLG